MTNRVSKVQRKTNETDIEVYLNIDGTGKSNINTGIGFCDHMLSAFAKHGRFDLNVDCTGDLEVDAHHSIEDIGISIGKAINESLGDRSGINRMGDATVPLDEAMVQSIVDISGRPFASIDLTFNSQHPPYSLCTCACVWKFNSQHTSYSLCSTCACVWKFNIQHTSYSLLVQEM